jgi:hypothetical protein
MFTLFVRLSVIQLCGLIIQLLNPSVLKKPLGARALAIEAALLCAFLSGGFQEYIEEAGVYGTPSRWAQVAFWAITSILLAVVPEKGK